MAKVKTDSSSTPRKMRPALTPEAAENQCVSLAMDLARKRLQEGTASSTEVVHFLKLGSRKERLEREKLEEENKLLRAKTENLQTQAKTEEAYLEVLRAMRTYSGQSDGDDNYEDY